MTRIILRSSHDWRVVGPVAAAAFAYFTAGASVLTRVADAPAPQTIGALVTRLALAIVVAAIMLVSERRRERPSVDAAVLEGIQVAAVVIIADNLGGGSDAGMPLVLRTALMLLGIPLLAVLTHLLARRMGGQTAPRAS